MTNSFLVLKFLDLYLRKIINKWTFIEFLKSHTAFPLKILKNKHEENSRKFSGSILWKKQISKYSTFIPFSAITKKTLPHTHQSKKLFSTFQKSLKKFYFKLIFTVEFLYFTKNIQETNCRIHKLICFHSKIFVNNRKSRKPKICQ